jgi:phosphatidate cytidylyltransferase
LSNLAKRLAVGILGIPAFIYLILQGDVFFFGLVFFLSNLCVWEFIKMSENKGAHPLNLLSILSNSALIGFSFFGLHNLEFGKFCIFYISILFLISLLHTGLNLWNNKSSAIYNIFTGLGATAYISFSFSSLLFIREFGYFYYYLTLSPISKLPLSYPDYGWICMAMFIGIWASDTGAYFVGSAIGKNKLFERISPKKSWEGACGGFVSAILGFSLTMYFTIPSFPVYLSIIIGAMIGIFGTIGDLAESQLKRDAGVKDSSNLIPGHGGFLDRFDSAIFVSPILFFVLVIFFCF